MEDSNKMEKTFEERLYEHFIYTNQLYNMRLDLSSNIEEMFDGIRIETPKYNSGKYATLVIKCDEDLVDEVDEYIDNLFTNSPDVEYYSCLGHEFDKETGLLKIWIEL